MNKRCMLVLTILMAGVGATVLVLVASARQTKIVGWEAPVQISDTEGNSGSARLVVDPENTVHLIWYDWIDLVSHPPYLQYANREFGGNWTDPEYLPDELRPQLPGTYGGEPAVVGGPDGSLHMVWENYRYIDNFNDAVTYISRDINGKWSTTEMVPSQDEWPSASQPDVGLGPDGSVHVVYQDWLGPNHQKTIQHAVRLPTGVWTATQQVTKYEGDYTLPMLAVDDVGTVHLIYTENYTDHYEFYYAHTITGGLWSAPVNMGVSPTPWNSVEQLTSGPNGRIHLVWAEIDQSILPWICTVKYRGQVRSGGWSVPITLGQHCASQVVVAADKYGLPHVAWKYDEKLWYAYQAPDGKFTYPVVVDETDQFHNSGEYLSIAIDSVGGRHVAWGSLHDGNIWYIGNDGNISVTSVISESGGTLFAFSGNTFVEIPTQAVSEDVILSHMPQGGTAPEGMEGINYFDLSAHYVSDGTPVTSFSEPYSITAYYTDAEISDINENSLGIYWWNNGAWEKVSTSAVDTTSNQVSASLDHMTQFAVLGERGKVEYYLNLPLIKRGTSP